MSPGKRLLSLCGFLTVAGLLTISGCHSAGGDGPPPATLATGKTESIRQIQANPNIPPQQKAAIIARLQGQGAPGAVSNAPPSR